MTANALFLVVLALAILISPAFHLAAIRWGLGWAKVAELSYTRAFGLLLVFVIAGFVAAMLAYALIASLSISVSDPVWNFIAILIQLAAACLVIVVMYKVRLRTAAQALVPVGVLNIALPLFVIYLIRPLAYEAYVIPTNGMAPTLLGLHSQAPCPRCGQPAYGAPLEHLRWFPEEGLVMNCSAEHRAVRVTDVPPETHGGDRILTCKFIAPQRWDLITFRFPGDPTVLYVMRLLGLPNEELSIRDGAVWINGERLTPPASLRGIHYTPTIEERGTVYAGPGSVPVRLGPDEYFVLGDFPEHSADSRLWEKGAPGYPPYAVPESYITGVVINIYWPPSRWISFR